MDTPKKLFVALGVGLGLYAVYFDYKRRSAPGFAKELVERP